jgi:hypothetical protein
MLEFLLSTDKLAMIAGQAFQPQSVCGIFGFLLAETRAFSGSRSQSPGELGNGRLPPV